MGDGAGRLPAHHRVLPLPAIARVIGVRPIGVGHGRIVLLDAALHFGKQAFLQRFRIGERTLAFYLLHARGRHSRAEVATSITHVLTWREGLVVQLTESAFYVAVKHGIKGSLLEVELCLYRVFRLAIRRVGQEALQCRMTIVRYS